jgi:hypothetical protein
MPIVSQILDAGVTFPPARTICTDPNVKYTSASDNNMSLATTAQWTLKSPGERRIQLNSRSHDRAGGGMTAVAALDPTKYRIYTECL